MMGVNKISQVTIVAVSSLGLMGAATMTTQAATWHQGTPTALRGHWKNKTINVGKYFGVKKLYSYESVRVKKNQINASLTQSEGWHITNTKWKSVGANAYTIIGTDMLNQSQQARFTFKRVGHGYVHIYYDGVNIAKNTPFSPNFYRVSKNTSY
ncbi:hypothetical protein FC51_GL000043 [Lentilactobacillus parabuchneri DSM 5707 = NBRC 107865]|uniref:Uncharacterized protein n=2 Tax=Lentilactobacillus parabuchneri TaxID=152331 RepID=A0A0R1YZ33_9LACO|nr:hypothetical protein FC51_GL000043 [Lentilactobacillus parabuchneri DSM 5707 = NBRC 107865]KRN77854.1 hypothetical protein IV42_GL002353 [Lentilactobacillus parabuchneri]